MSKHKYENREFKKSKPSQKDREENEGQTCPSGIVYEKNRGERDKGAYPYGQPGFDPESKRDRYWNADPASSEQSKTYWPDEEPYRREDAADENPQGKQTKKEKVDAAQAPSLEDWEGGGSRPEQEDRPEQNIKNKKNKKAA